MPEPHGIVRRDLARKLNLDPKTATFGQIREKLSGEDGWGGNQALREEMNARLDGAHPLP